MTTKQTPKTLLTTDKATLIDIIGMEIEMGGKTFTADWIDAPKSEDDGKIMIQSDETDVHYIGDKDESIFDAFMEIHSELRKESKRMTIQLSETAEILLKRIVESRLGSGAGSGLSLMRECMVEHLIWEEARRLGVTDYSQSEDCSHPQTSVPADEDLERKMEVIQ